jgi:hypothetical protein
MLDFLADRGRSSVPSALGVAAQRMPEARLSAVTRGRVPAEAVSDPAFQGEVDLGFVGSSPQSLDHHRRPSSAITIRGW